MTCADWVERTDDLLANLTTKTFSYLLEVGFLKFRPFFQLHSLVVTDTLDFFRVIQTAEVYLGAIGNTTNAVLRELEHFKDTQSLCSHLVVLINGFQNGCTDLTHYQGILTIEQCLHQNGLCGTVRLGRGRTTEKDKETYTRIVKVLQQIKGIRIKFLIVQFKFHYSSSLKPIRNTFLPPLFTSICFASSHPSREDN